MSYRVIWRPSALDDLAAVWTAADSERRRAITAATESIDELLRNDPEHAGESREAGRRILFAGSLVVVFRVLRDENVVHVLRAWGIR